MTGEPTERKKSPPKIVHISKARRLKRKRRPDVEPPYAIGALWAENVEEKKRTVIVEAEIRADLNVGDPLLTTIRKVDYVLENAGQAYRDDEARTELVVFMVDIIRDYGEPEGIDTLRKAAELYGEKKEVREAISSAVVRIGCKDGLHLILFGLRYDDSNPSSHLPALLDFVRQFPETIDSVLKFLEPFASLNSAFEDAVSEIRNLQK